jgi:hypothetical protein
MDLAEFVEVPVDDYRSIRRAILDLDGFEAAYAARAGEHSPDPTRS